MSGHSKWNNIKATKEKSDSQRAKVFTKLSREIVVALKHGNPDPETNSKLKLAIAKARQSNMPNEKINNLLKKSTNEADYIEIIYEGYGPGGVAVIVECLTDNKNRTASDVRHIFDKYGGSLGSTGCVSYLFSKKGVVAIDKDAGFNLVKAEDIAIMNDAENYENLENVFTVYTAPNDYAKISEVYTKQGFNIISSGNDMIPSNYVLLNEQDSQKFKVMLEKFEDNDDIQNVYHNQEE